MGDTSDKNDYQSQVESGMEAPIPIKKQQTVEKTPMADKAKEIADAQAAIIAANKKAAEDAKKPENSYREQYKKMYGEYPKQ